MNATKKFFVGLLPLLAMTINLNADTIKEKHWMEEEQFFFDNVLPKEVKDSGFIPFLNWEREVWSNVSGVGGNSIFNSLLTFGFELDFEKLAKSEAPLGKIAMSNFYYDQTNELKNAGRMSDASNLFTDASVRVFEIFYENEFETQVGNFSFRIGQLAADEDFMCLEYSDLFLNSSFGAITAVSDAETASGAMAFSQYANATAGLALAYKNEGGWDIRLGVYNGNAGVDEKGNHGFDYDFQGVALWYQIGYHYEISDLQGMFALGGNYNSNEFKRFDSEQLERNMYSFYLLFQQELLKDTDGNTLLGAFARAAYNPSKSICPTQFYADAGINWFSPIPSRDKDVFGVAIGFSQAGTALRESRNTPKYETCIEATYRVQLMEFMFIQPCFQIYFNPENDRGDRTTKYILGMHAEINF